MKKKRLFTQIDIDKLWDNKSEEPDGKYSISFDQIIELCETKGISKEKTKNILNQMQKEQKEIKR